MEFGKSPENADLTTIIKEVTDIQSPESRFQLAPSIPLNPYNSEANGKFKLSLLKFDTCKGPKRLDCCIISVKVENKTHIKYNIEIKKNTIPNRGKVTASMNNHPLIRLQMRKPCDHLYMKPLFQSLLNVTQNCEFQKGNYTLDIDIDEVAQTYYGGMFFYGNMEFKSMFYNDECNFSCAELKVNFAAPDSR